MRNSGWTRPSGLFLPSAFHPPLTSGWSASAAKSRQKANIADPSQTHLVLVTDLYEGGDAKAMLGRAAALVNSGVNLIVLLALNNDGRPSYDGNMATALKRGDLNAWASSVGIGIARHQN